LVLNHCNPDIAVVFGRNFTHCRVRGKTGAADRSGFAAAWSFSGEFPSTFLKRVRLWMIVGFVFLAL
jgi:hypothetical protein